MKIRMLSMPAWLLMLSFVISACLPTQAPAPTATLTQQPPTAPPTEAQPTETLTPTAVPVSLAGPADGSKMAWLDGGTLVYVPSSQFQMGTGALDAPVHAVSVDGFWMYATKVTNRMYSQCVSIGSCTAPTQEVGGPVYSNPEFANHPIVGVTWDQANGYCTWVGGRLPTEAEWELAARGTTAALYPWGNDEPTCDLANYGDCEGHTTKVTDYPAGKSVYGALDMLGNVFEWVNDWYDEAYFTSAPGANPLGPDSGQFRVVRGSSFESTLQQTLSGIRRFNEPLDHSYDTSFRCAVSGPKAYAPFCQLSPFIPAGQPVVSTATCEQPAPEVRGSYCVANLGYVTVDLPDGATFDLLDERMDCSDAVVDNERRLTCNGPVSKEITGDISVCNATCSAAPDVTGATIACPSGFNFDPTTDQCIYSPILNQLNPLSCPAGYVLVGPGGSQTCALAPGADGLCPQGLYYDSLYGACAPANGLVAAPYGIDDSALASQNYEGCAAGYSYSELNQCCQAPAVASYPGCAPGTNLPPEAGVCSPPVVQNPASPGCATVTITIPKCGRPPDVCKRITSETHCIQNSFYCRWIDDVGCVLK